MGGDTGGASPIICVVESSSSTVFGSARDSSPITNGSSCLRPFLPIAIEEKTGRRGKSIPLGLRPFSSTLNHRSRRAIFGDASERPTGS
jgi:hypothetical protein